MNFSRFHISDNIFILSDYKRDGRYFERLWRLLHGVPQFHKLTNWKILKIKNSIIRKNENLQIQKFYN